MYRDERASQPRVERGEIDLDLGSGAKWHVKYNVTYILVR